MLGVLGLIEEDTEVVSQITLSCDSDYDDEYDDPDCNPEGCQDYEPDDD